VVPDRRLADRSVRTVKDRRRVRRNAFVVLHAPMLALNTPLNMSACAVALLVPSHCVVCCGVEQLCVLCSSRSDPQYPDNCRYDDYAVVNYGSCALNGFANLDSVASCSTAAAAMSLAYPPPAPRRSTPVHSTPPRACPVLAGLIQTWR
jgi:hypothetical protein